MSTKHGGGSKKFGITPSTVAETLTIKNWRPTVSSINDLKPAPGRWGNVSDFVLPYMDVLHTMADAELSAEKTIYNFWDHFQPRNKPPALPIVRRVAEEVRKIAYREGWWSCGDEYPTQVIAWRICQDWQEERT